MSMSLRGAAALILVLLTPLAALHAESQSLAAVAQQAAEERAAKADAAATPPAKVYTNKDAVPLPPPPADVVEPIAPPGRTTIAPAKTAMVPARSVKNEAYWKDRMRALQSTLAGDEARLLISIRLHDEVAISGRGAAGQSQLVDAAAAMTRWTASVDNDRRAIVELEAEARRASVPSGWLRSP
jgi:hypothetical protein